MDKYTENKNDWYIIFNELERLIIKFLNDTRVGFKKEWTDTNYNVFTSVRVTRSVINYFSKLTKLHPWSSLSSCFITWQDKHANHIHDKSPLGVCKLTQY